MFLGEPVRVFYHCFFRFFHVPIDFYYCFWMFSLLNAFIHFIVSGDVFISPTFFTVTVFRFVVQRVLRIWESFSLLSGIFYLTFPPKIWHNQQFTLEGCRVSHWGSKHRPGPSVCLNHTVYSKRYYSASSIYVLGAATDYYISGFELIILVIISYSIRRAYYTLDYWTF